MPRLRNELTGAVMTVPEATAARLGGEWVDANKAARSETPDATWKIADLKAYAEENEIDLGDAKKKEDLLAAIAGTTSDENPDE